MEISFKAEKSAGTSTYSGSIQEILKLCGDEFTPPLRYRNSVVQTDFSSEKEADRSYFRVIQDQPILLSLSSKDELVGIISYQERYSDSNLAKYIPATYVTTVIVHPKFRGKGTAEKMYLELMSIMRDNFICTRTWSTNYNHIKLLDKLGFIKLQVIVGNRGKEIDTIYYGKSC